MKPTHMGKQLVLARWVRLHELSQFMLDARLLYLKVRLLHFRPMTTVATSTTTTTQQQTPPKAEHCHVEQTHLPRIEEGFVPALRLLLHPMGVCALERRLHDGLTDAIRTRRMDIHERNDMIRQAN